jgi:hypothetical protein
MTKPDEAAFTDKDEVQAHRQMTKPDEAAFTDKDEVQAHGFEILYDEALEAYQIKE